MLAGKVGHVSTGNHHHRLAFGVRSEANRHLSAALANFEVSKISAAHEAVEELMVLLKQHGVAK